MATVKELPNSRIKSMLPTVEEVQDDRVVMAKAIFDSVMAKIPEQLSKAVQPQLKEIVSALVGGALRKELSDIMAEVKNQTITYQKSLSELKKEYQQQLAEYAKSYDGRLEEAEKLFTSQLREVKAIHSSQLEEVKSYQQEGFEQIVKVVKGLPTPQVFVPPEAIKSEFSIPRNAVNVEIKAGDVIVPDNAIQVNVENKTLFDVPARKTTTEKSILYDRDL